MKSFFDSLDGFLRKALILLVAGIVVTTVLQVIARFVLSISIPWTDELARYLMIWCAYLGLGVAFRKGELICVAYFTDKLPSNLLKKIKLASDALCSIFAAVVVVYGIKLCIINADQVSPSLRFPLSLVYAAVPIGCLLFILFAFESVASIFSTDRPRIERGDKS
jgi:TRAP-type transport system small permease protein